MTSRGLICALALCLVVGLTSRDAEAQVPPPEDYLYFWVPRIKDVDRRDTDRDHALLKYLVEHASEDEYTVTADDRNGLDDIIRRKFLLSSTPFPNAFNIYKQNIYSRNRGLAENTPLIPGKTVLKLPSGPRYAGFEMPGLDLTSYYSEANRTFGHIKASVESIRRSLGDTLLAYTSRAKKIGSDIPQFAFENGIDEIVARRIVPAQSDRMRAKNIVTPTESVRIADAIENAPADVRPRAASLFLPASPPLDDQHKVDCKGVCDACQSILAVPVLVSGNVRLLIADTGIADAPNAKKVYSATPGNYADVDPDSHGSFVYSEVVKTLKGVLDPKLVEVAKVAVPLDIRRSPTGRPYQWSIGALKTAIDQFAIRYSNMPVDLNDPKVPPVWVVNVSAGGRPQLGEEVPLLLASDRILLVAAAGNDHSYDAPRTIVFPTLNSADRNLLIVGALDQDNRSLASYSNFNESRVDIFVRGNCVCGTPQQLNGTSQATPIVSVAALTLAAKFPHWDARQIKMRLISSSDLTPEVSRCDLGGFTGRCGVGGVLNLGRAIENSTSITYTTTDANTVQSHVNIRLDPAQLASNTVWASFLRLGTKDQVLRIHRESCDNAGLCDMLVYRLGNEPRQMKVMPPLELTINGKPQAISFYDIIDLYITLP